MDIGRAGVMGGCVSMARAAMFRIVNVTDLVKRCAPYDPKRVLTHCLDERLLRRLEPSVIGVDEESELRYVAFGEVFAALRPCMPSQ